MTNPTSTTRSLQSRGNRLSLSINLIGEQLLFIGSMSYPQAQFAEGDAMAYNRQLVEILGKLCLLVNRTGITLTADHKREFLQRLRETGEAAYAQFFPSEARKRLQQLDAKKQPEGLSPTFMIPSARSLFWELLYAGDPLGDTDAEQFWGFRYPIGRMYMGIEDEDTINLQEGVFSAIHDQLVGARAEIEELGRQIAEICDLLGMQLKLKLLDQTIAADALSPDQLIRIMVSDEFRYGLIHLACHCVNPQDAGVAQAFLRLTAHGQELELRLEKLQSVQSRYHLIHRPLVFLNACESATPGHLLQMLNFPTGMLGFGAGGVIATACAMPDDFASAFAAAFYKRLLDRARRSDDMAATIGEALLETRRYFLEEHNNPLGLAYGLYAVATQQLHLGD
jgi:hypothetical protein